LDRHFALREGHVLTVRTELKDINEVTYWHKTDKRGPRMRSHPRAELAIQAILVATVIVTAFISLASTNVKIEGNRSSPPALIVVHQAAAWSGFDARLQARANYERPR
jgi:hypothetical protein